jgi:hypothetical protein
MPGVSGVTVVTNARVYYTPRAAAGASGARHSLRSLMSEGRTSRQNSGALRGEIAKLCVALPGRHHPRKRVIQYSREVNIPEKSIMNREAAAYWMPAFAGMTTSCGAASCIILLHRATIPKFRYEIEDGRLASLSPPCNL